MAPPPPLVPTLPPPLFPFGSLRLPSAPLPSHPPQSDNVHLPPAVVAFTISPNINTQLSTQPPFHHPTVFPQENLLSSSASVFDPSATIPTPFTTDNQQSTWLPSPSSAALPAHSTQHPLSQDLSQLDQQDFQLFDSPAVHRSPSSVQQQALAGQHRRHSSNQYSALSLQPQRVAAIINSTGHSISTSALTRFNPAQQQQFYASSAPSSSTGLNQQRQTRPQVPLFSQSTGNIHSQQATNMAQGTSPAYSHASSHDSRTTDMDLFDDFTAFEGGASTQHAYQYSAQSSPAVPTIYDPSVNLSSSSSTNMGTVSPQDLHVRDPFASAPNSTAFTNLTSPSTYNESPEYTDNFDVSPFVGGNGDLDQTLGDPWYPLFPQDGQNESSQVQQSPLLPEEELEVSEALRSANPRRRSGTGTSPTSGTHSSVSGVASRKRDKPLPPIIVEDPNDTIAMKRARNTLAARKSRQRKMQRFDELEERISKLEEERDHWKNIALRRQ
ncbi:Cross-pathway control 1 [Hyphodiscus hymeniophilus]|uniref:Cross-pathway control 1 n=1 Tax=Hyphodiscus hymeniophilus TaxID=353542 RepID=A0A9P6VLU9_9HELO|nr:Cross-pathway control 1 [Hyphodiscus hymeniophilus]